MIVKPRVRDGEATQAKVLKASEKLFAKNGFNGTSIGMISKESGVSDGLILHHYKSKENLYSIIREHVASRYALELAKSIELKDISGELMREIYYTAFNSFKKNKNYQRISFWANLEGKEDIVKIEAQLTLRMIELIRKAQDSGLIEDNVEPIFLLTMIRGTIQYWLRYRDQFMKIMKTKEGKKKYDQRFLKQTFELFRKCTEKRGK